MIFVDCQISQLSVASTAKYLLLIYIDVKLHIKSVVFFSCNLYISLSNKMKGKFAAKNK